MPFRNAGGEENDWAERMMGDSVPMNKGNKAATVIGNGFPKIVVLTFWNDPSNPQTGGVNYGYFVELSLDMLPGNGHDGGMILLGPQGKGLDLGHVSQGVVEINEWMGQFLEFMKACKAGGRPDARKLPKSVPDVLEHVVDQFKNGVEVVDKANNTGDAYQTNERKKKAAKKYDREHFIEIDGQKLVRDKRYVFSYQNGSLDGTGEMTPITFMEKHGLEYKEGLIRIRSISEVGK